MPDQKLAIVTGGTRGIGAAICRALVENDYKVIATYHSNDIAAQSFAAQTGVLVKKFDVADYEACAIAATEIERDHGPVAVLVNNAGITRDAMLHKMDETAWNDVLKTNLYSCFNMCHAVIGNMRARNFGRIINISSINGQKGQLGQTNYAAAKAGMLGFTKALALESAAKGITVNAICPGYIETEMTSSMNPEVLEGIIRQIPAARMGKPCEVAAAVLFLASETASFVNGSTLTVNGGQYMAA